MLVLVPWGQCPTSRRGKEEFWDLAEASVLLW